MIFGTLASIALAASTVSARSCLFLFFLLSLFPSSYADNLIVSLSVGGGRYRATMLIHPLLSYCVRARSPSSSACVFGPFKALSPRVKALASLEELRSPMLARTPALPLSLVRLLSFPLAFLCPYSKTHTFSPLQPYSLPGLVCPPSSSVAAL
jgi:hypothetical protein